MKPRHAAALAKIRHARLTVSGCKLAERATGSSGGEPRANPFYLA
jgi:hypothetical protein